MHSRIFQLSIKPISEDDYITEELFYNGFVDTIADYVVESTDRKKDIDWLINIIKPYDVDYNYTEQSIIFNKEFKNNYFRSVFNEFKTISKKMILDEFSGNSANGNLYLLENIINDKFDFYIYEDDWCRTLNNFVRTLKENQKYYIGSVLDYHY